MELGVLLHLDLCLWHLDSTSWVGSCSWVNLSLFLIHLLDDWTELITMAVDCGLQLLELALTHRVWVLIWIVILHVLSLVLTRYLHSVDVFDDHLLIMRCQVGLIVLVNILFLLLLVWIGSLLDVLDGRCLLSLNVEGRLADWLASTVQLKIGLLWWWLS